MFVQHDLDIFLLLRTSCSDLYIPLFIGLFAFMIICVMYYLHSLFIICIPEKIFVHSMFIAHTQLTFPFEMFSLVGLFLYVCHFFFLIPGYIEACSASSLSSFLWLYQIGTACAFFWHFQHLRLPSWLACFYFLITLEFILLGWRACTYFIHQHLDICFPRTLCWKFLSRVYVWHLCLVRGICKCFTRCFWVSTMLLLQRHLSSTAWNLVW